MKRATYKVLLTVMVIVLGSVVAKAQAYDDPPSITAKYTSGTITVDGNLNEADWANAQTLVFGNLGAANAAKLAGEKTVTASLDIKGTPFDVHGKKYSIPYKDSSYAKVKFLRKGMNLYIGIQSNDKQVCSFGDSWEGDGLFMQIKNSAGVTKEYKLYYNYGDSVNAPIHYEASIVNSGSGAGMLVSGKNNDTTDTDGGYTAELMVKLDVLGYTNSTSGVQASLNIFDPDYFQGNKFGAFDSARGSFGKSFWGSEWGGTMKTINLEADPNLYDDPASVTVNASSSEITVDGNLNEAAWATAQTLVFGTPASANAAKGAGEYSVTGNVDVKAGPFDVHGVKYSLPYKDTSYAKVKFLRKGMNLYIGIQSNDKQVCSFGDSWEGDGLFMQIKNSAGVTKEYKLYYNYGDSVNAPIHYEASIVNSGSGAGMLVSGKNNDTTDTDGGYTAELMVKLDVLGYTNSTSGVQASLNIFDPDYFQGNKFGAFDSARGSFGKSFWGSEWGGTMKTINLEADPNLYDDPASVTVNASSSEITVDGNLNEAAWATAQTLVFGTPASANAAKGAGEYSVTGNVDVKAGPFDVHGVKYSLPYKDTSYAKVKFLRKGMNLYIGIQSNDKSVCSFGDSWEGDGLFMQMKNPAGVTKEYKLYYNYGDSVNAPIHYEASVANSGSGAGKLVSGKNNDTSDVDGGYTAELQIKLDALGFKSDVSSLQASLNIFDPDGFPGNKIAAWDSARGAFFKSFWGSEWGGNMKKIDLQGDPNLYDDPASLDVVDAAGTVTVDGKLDEADWANAKTLVFGAGTAPKNPGEYTVSGNLDVKGNPFDVHGVKYSIPYKDTSYAKVKFLRKGMNLYIGIQSNDKSICSFGDSWEGDGLFMQMKNAAGVTKEYKLYYNIGDSVKAPIHYEASVANSGSGAGIAVGKTNDTTDVDGGYTAELQIKLDALGFTKDVASLQASLNIFDPDGFPGNKVPAWDSARGQYFKSWWGSEWGGTMKTLKLNPQYSDPDSVFAIDAPVLVDGKLDEPEWSDPNINTLVFGAPNAPRSGNEKTVSGNVDVKAGFEVNKVKYSLPYKDTSYAKVKFLHRGMNLYIGIQSNDKSICSFGDSWEGDGLFMQVKNSAGAVKEFKLFYNLTGVKGDTTIHYEESVLNSGAGAGVAVGKVNDTTDVDGGYTAELRIRLDALGYNSNTKELLVSMNIFDPDGYPGNKLAAWDSARGQYFKSWWGSEWGGTMKKISFKPVTGVGADDVVPTVYAMSQNYPNPFNPTTNIKFSVPQASVVKIVVYDILGREVTTLVNGNYAIGNFTVPFNASNIASGMYIYRMTSQSLSGSQKQFTDTKKLMLLK